MFVALSVVRFVVCETIWEFSVADHELIHRIEACEMQSHEILRFTFRRKRFESERVIQHLPRSMLNATPPNKLYAGTTRDSDREE